MPSTWMPRPFVVPHHRPRLARFLKSLHRKRTDAVTSGMLHAELYAAAGVALALFAISATVIAFVSLTE